MIACPSERELACLQLGELSARTAQRLAAHVAACAVCQQRLPQPVLHTDPMMSQLVPPVSDRPQPECAITFLDPPQGPDELGWLGHYRVLRLLGRGGMGMVFAAEDSQLRRPVALKVLLPEQAGDAESRTRFLREARAMAAVRHDHVVTIYQVGQAGDVCFLAMELLEGETLGQRLQRRPRLDLSEVLRLGQEVCAGLAAAHQRGLIHRDVKPDNIWLEKPAGRVKLLDFGLARATQDDTRLTKTGYILGTPGYMAPEQARGAQGDARADLFGLGCVLYRVLADRLAFSGPNSLAILTALAVDTPPPLEEVAPTTPPLLIDLVNQLLAKEPQHRPDAALEVGERLSELARALTAGTLAAGNPAAGRRLPDWTQTLPAAKPFAAAKPAKPNRRPLLLTAVLLPAAAAVGFLLFRGGDDPGAAAPARTEPSTQTMAQAPPVDPHDAWLRQVAALPRDQQMEAVVAELKKRNPNFDGTVQTELEGGNLTALRMITDEVTDITPLRALTGLKRLRLAGGGAKTGKLADLNPLAGLPLRVLELHNNPPIQDLSPLRGMPLEYLNLNHSGVRDLTPLEKSSLTYLSLWECPVTDLTPLRALPLTEFTCVSSPLRDLSPLAGKKLIRLAIQNTQVDDLAPLRGMPLKTLTHDFRLWRDEEVLLTLKDIQWLVGRPTPEFWMHVRTLHADLDAWCAKVEKLPPAEQVKAVAAKLARDPRFDSLRVRFEAKDGVVEQLTLPAAGLDDLAPLRALKGLRRLTIAGVPGSQASFTDLAPLRGLPLEQLACPHTKVRILTPLLGMPLTSLDITGADVTDLTPLRDLPLQHLRLTYLPAQAAALTVLPKLLTINGQPKAAVLGQP